LSKRKKKYYIFHKPYGVLCQFTPEHGKTCLGDLLQLSKDVYPVGRLDENSEGLLILSNDGQFKHQLLDPEFEHSRSYWAQLDGKITQEAIDQLQNGVTIKLKNSSYHTLPTVVEQIDDPPVQERAVRVDYNREKGYSWIKITLREGKNRQVRKMTAAVGFPTARLIRCSIGELQLGNLAPGDLMSVNENWLRKKTGMVKPAAQ
tara:strand:+ start:1327 stop:1938 length:612 start_codon:yes stop_codon:yes gene_type:complete